VAHGVEVWRSYTWLERVALRGARRILCVSDFTRQEMQRRIALPAARFAVVPNALDPYFAGALDGAPAGPLDPVILTVSRLDVFETGKGVDQLIQAMPAIRAAVPGARLHIVGTGGALPRLKDLARSVAPPEAIDFAGQVTDAELGRWYAGCRIFALPSRKEGFGLVFLEAMAHGRPCVAVRAGGAPEVVDSSCGILVDSDDGPALAQACIAALTRVWDHAAIKRQAARFSFPCFRDRLAEVLENRL
jgi:glycosyltransferase involved in cell wall biosynthesis